MKELSLHILDIIQNAIQAKASVIKLLLEEDIKNNNYVITITDNGSGMQASTLTQILDPFYTTKNKKTGLGIPLLKQHAEQTGGILSIFSEPGIGTTVRAEFSHSHYDRQPLGNITSTLTGLIRAYPKIEFEYKHSVDDKEFILNTEEIKQELEGIPIESKEVIAFITEMIQENLKKISIT